MKQKNATNIYSDEVHLEIYELCSLLFLRPNSVYCRVLTKAS